MAQYAVIIMHQVPDIGSFASQVFAYRAEAVDEAAAVEAASAQMSTLPHTMKVWAIPASAMVAYRIDVASTQTVVVDI